MTIAYATLNAILARWLTVEPQGAALDCGDCKLPYKCCAFQPFVANFLLGAVLEQQGQLPVPKGFTWQALGLVPTAEFRAGHAQAALKSQVDSRWVCAFFDHKGRQCSIWDFRPGECSSYLCAPPQPGRQQMSEMAFAVETAVSQMALVQLGFTPEQIGAEIDNLNHPERGIISSPGEAAFDLYRHAWAWARHLRAEQVVEWLDWEKM